MTMRLLLPLAAFFATVASTPTCVAVILNADFELTSDTSGARFPQADNWGGDARLALHSEYGPGTFGTLGARFVFNQDNGSGPAWQTLGDTFASGFSYTFDAVGYDNGSGADVVFEIGYGSGDQFVLLSDATYDQNVINGDNWVRHQGVTYTPPSNADAIGENITVRFRSTALQGVWLDDAALTITEAPVSGDVDGDREVTLADYFIIRDNFQSIVSNRSQGDLTGPSGVGDGLVDFYDFVEWNSFYPESPGLSYVEAGVLAESFNAVPEPAGSFILSLGFLLVSVGSSANRHRS